MGIELANNGKNQVTENFAVKRISGTGTKRKVDGEALTLPFTQLVEMAGTRVKRILMGGEVQNIGTGVEDFLGSVAMVDIEVNNGHPFHRTVSDCPIGGHRDVVEQAKSHHPVALSMMAGRPNQGESGVDVSS